MYTVILWSFRKFASWTPLRWSYHLVLLGPVVVLKGLTFKKFTFCPLIAFTSMCFMWLSQKECFLSLYSINWLVFTTEAGCLLRGTNWMFTYVSSRSSSLSVNYCRHTFRYCSQLCTFYRMLFLLYRVYYVSLHNLLSIRLRWCQIFPSSITSNLHPVKIFCNFFYVKQYFIRSL